MFYRQTHFVVKCVKERPNVPNRAWVMKQFVEEFE